MATKKPAAKKPMKSVSKSTKTPTKRKSALTANAFADRVRESAQDIWLAGLGAFAKAQDEGTRVYDVLVKEGRSIQGRVRGLTKSVKGKLNDANVSELSGKLTARWSDLGQMVEERASTALSRAGVATKKEVEKLSSRVSKLATEVERVILGKKPAASKPVKTAKTPAKATPKAPFKTVAKAVAKVKAPVVAAKASAKPVKKLASKPAPKSVPKSVVSNPVTKPAAKPAAKKPVVAATKKVAEVPSPVTAVPNAASDVSTQPQVA